MMCSGRKSQSLHIKRRMRLGVWRAQGRQSNKKLLTLKQNFCHRRFDGLSFDTGSCSVTQD